MTPKASRTIRASIFTLLMFSPVMFIARVQANVDRRPAVEGLIVPEDFTDTIEAPLEPFCSTDAECEELKAAQWNEYQSCLSVYNPETIIEEEEEECWRDGQAACLKYSSDPDCMDLDEV